METKGNLYYRLLRLMSVTDEDFYNDIPPREYVFSDENRTELRDAYYTSDNKGYREPFPIDAFCQGCKLTPDKDEYFANWTLEFPVDADMGKIELLNEVLTQGGIIINYKTT